MRDKKRRDERQGTSYKIKKGRETRKEGMRDEKRRKGMIKVLLNNNINKN